MCPNTVAMFIYSTVAYVNSQDDITNFLVFFLIHQMFECNIMFVKV